MAEFQQIDPNQDVAFDRYGRYVLPFPGTGEKTSFTRATTIANAIKDRYGLEKWAQRNIVYGLGRRIDLFAMAASANRADDRTLSEIVEQAEQAAASTSSANMGTAIHKFAESIDRGQEPAIPDNLRPDLDAYTTEMSKHGVKVVDDMIERLVCLPHAGVAGTFDRLVTVDGRDLPLIGDIKTPKDKVNRDGGTYNSFATYSVPDASLQLSIYAHADYYWTPAGWVEMPEVDQEYGVIMHVPAGQGECRLYAIDLTAGWRAVQLALDVRRWRKDSGSCMDLSELPRQASTRVRMSPPKGEEGVSVDPPEDSPAPAAATTALDERLEWLRTRVELIKAHTHARPQLAAIWKGSFPEIPTFPKDGPRDHAEIDSIAGACALVEMEWSIPFPDEDPLDAVATGQEIRKGMDK